MGRLVLEVSFSSRTRDGDFLRARWNRALSVKVIREGLLRDSERAGIGGLGSTSRVAMIGSVLLVGREGSGGCIGTVGLALLAGMAGFFAFGLIGVVVTTEAGLCG